MDVEIITNDRHAGRQYYALDRIVRVGDARLRTEIHRDTSYDFQSYARISLWDGKKWSVVASLTGTDHQMALGPSAYAEPAARERWQDAVADRLLTTARAVIE